MTRAAVSLLFLLSGAVGLLYEVVWAKYLALALGSTAVAQSLVLAAFLGGLSLGNALLGRRADRNPNPLRLYALLEAGVAVFGLLSPVLLAALVKAPLGKAASTALACLILVPPTFLMGGTLPALSRLAVSDLSQMEAAVSWFYFLNSAGAAAGTVAAGFWLLPRLGLDRSLLLGGGLNILVAALALWLSRRLQGARLAPAAPAAEPAPPVSRLAVRVLLAGAFLSGFVSLLYEICWIRLLALSLGSSTYSFSLMLSAFVAGISLGSLVVSRGWLGRKDPVLLFGLAELGVLLSILFTLPFYERLPYYTYLLDRLIQPTPGMFCLREALRSGLCFALTLLPTAFIGMTLPLASRAAAAGPDEVGAAVGRVFALNTLGNVLGSLCAGLWLMPALGLQRMILAGLGMNLLLGCAAVWAARSWPAWGKFMASGLCATAFAAVAAFGPRWEKPILTAGLFRDPEVLRGATQYGYEVFRRAMAKTRLLYYKDDRESTVTVEAQGDKISLKVNGKTDASSYWDMPTQLLLAHVPLLLKPASEDVLLVGLGSGITAGAVLSHPVRRLDVVEITPSVAEAARLFDPFSNRALDDPRLRLSFDDGKAFLKRAPRLYDVILTEPSNPWIAGVGNLFSVEYFEQARAHLKPGGVAVQWFHLYRMNDDTVRLVVRTFCSVFPHVTLWHALPDDILLLGTEEPMPDDFAALERRMAEPRVAADLAKIGIRWPGALLALQISSADWVSRLAGMGPVNTDRRPILEYTAPLTYFLKKTSWLVYDNDQRGDQGRGDALALDRWLKARGRRFDPERTRELLPLLSNGSPALRRRLLRDWIARRPADDEPRLKLARLEYEEFRLDACLASLAPLLGRKPPSREALELSADVAAESKDFARAVGVLKVLLMSPGKDAVRLHKKASQLYLKLDQPEPAMDQLDLAAEAAPAVGAPDEPNSADIWLEAVNIALHQYDSARAKKYALKILARDPENAIARGLYDRLEEVDRKFPPAQEEPSPEPQARP